MLRRALRFDRGFEAFVSMPYRSSKVVFTRLLSWLEEHRDEQVFAYVHSMEPHEPYEPIEAFRRRVEVPPYDGPFDGGSDALNRITRSVLSGFDLTDENEPITWADIEYLESLYLAEVAQWDFIFGSLLRRMSREGLLEHTAIVVTGDHGEEFLEHGSLRHCRTLYEEVLQVPLLISYPARIPAGRVKQPVPWSALARTICDLAGAPPPPGAQGPSLLDVASGKAHAGPIVSSTSLGRTGGDPRLRAIESIRQADLKPTWVEEATAASPFDPASDPAPRPHLPPARTPTPPPATAAPPTPTRRGPAGTGTDRSKLSARRMGTRWPSTRACQPG